jgi:hypothetical protein
MTHVRCIALLLVLSLGTLSGCAARLTSSPLPEGFSIKNLAPLDAGAPFAVNGTGGVAVVAEGVLLLADPAGGPGRVLAPAPATDLSFSPDGKLLAASFATPTQSLLQLFDLQGNSVAQALVPGRVTSLAWRSEKELLAASLAIKRFSFGSELASYLNHWDLVAAPAVTPLGSVTIRPTLAKLPDATLYKSLGMTLSPYGDEIAYSAIKDPPLFTSYQRIAVRNLDSGAEREVAEVGIGSGAPCYTPDGASLLVGSERSLTRRLALFDGKEIDGWPSPGDRLALSPSGSYLFLDGRVYQGGRELISFPTDSKGAFLPDGSGIAIGHGGGLFLVSGLQAAPRPRLPELSEQLLEQRRLHLLGVITDAEFKKAQKKALVP